MIDAGLAMAKAARVMSGSPMRAAETRGETGRGGPEYASRVRRYRNTKTWFPDAWFLNIALENVSGLANCHCARRGSVPG